MKRFLTQLFTVCAVLTLGASAAFAAEGWGENYEKAAAQAKAEKKLLLLDFTGSDWCGWCIKLNKEVFSQAEFKEYAAKNLVLMEVDFPQTKPQAANIKAQNARLQAKYKIEGYPTIVVLNPDGKKVGELGYQPGGPKAFTAALDGFKK
ncbi:MAG: thioredoxin family protein [Chthoniobacter sp.]|uniref:thioredoxin family protein n=1 Tax=Chthoniobacter sp. TaxID=2510640 RepID=UPI0032A1C82E